MVFWFYIISGISLASEISLMEESCGDLWLRAEGVCCDGIQATRARLQIQPSVLSSQ